MKVYFNGYKENWISPYTILEKVLWWKDWEKIWEDPWVEKWANRLAPISETLRWVLNKVRPQIFYVKIDDYDIWSMDHTLAKIILPMLKKLKEKKHGAPYVDDEDVPENIRSTSAKAKENEWDIDEFHFDRWDWVISEMIWAFEQKTIPNDESQFYDLSEVNWKEGLAESSKKMKFDEEGYSNHQKRKENGYRLFGKYYSGLWD